jgi:hypothetical protein
MGFIMRHLLLFFPFVGVFSGAAGAQTRVPPTGFDAGAAIFDIQPGTVVRADESPDAPPVYTVWHRLTARGEGVCTAVACRLKVNDRDVYAERERLVIARRADADPATVVLDDDEDYPAGWLRLRLGDRGDSVKELQNLLVKDGAEITPDGVFGPATEAAIRDLQRRWRLQIDGAAGHRTLYLLGVIGDRARERAASF